jgi:hypothetical protein
MRLLGLELGPSGPGCQRFAGVVDNGILLRLKVESSPGDLKLTHVQGMLGEFKKVRGRGRRAGAGGRGRRPHGRRGRRLGPGARRSGMGPRARRGGAPACRRGCLWRQTSYAPSPSAPSVRRRRPRPQFFGTN